MCWLVWLLYHIFPPHYKCLKLWVCQYCLPWIDKSIQREERLELCVYHIYLCMVEVKGCSFQTCFVRGMNHVACLSSAASDFGQSDCCWTICRLSFWGVEAFMLFICAACVCFASFLIAIRCFVILLSWLKCNCGILSLAIWLSISLWAILMTHYN